MIVIFLVKIRSNDHFPPHFPCGIIDFTSGFIKLGNTNLDSEAIIGKYIKD
jgi:hypothetical protein